MREVMNPAIEMAERGFPVGPIASHFWKESEGHLQRSRNGREMLVDGERAPAAGGIFRNCNLAATFRTLAEEGKAGFYRGRVAQAIVDALTEESGDEVCSVSDDVDLDLAGHVTCRLGLARVGAQGAHFNLLPRGGHPRDRTPNTR